MKTITKSCWNKPKISVENLSYEEKDQKEENMKEIDTEIYQMKINKT